MAEVALPNNGGSRSYRYLPSWHLFPLILLLMAFYVIWNAVSILSSSSFAIETTNINKNSSRTSPSSSSDSPLPDALQPVSFDRCCDNSLFSWESTCFTEKACNSSVYPFSSAEEAALFAHHQRNTSEEALHRKRCDEANDRLAPPTQWCQETHDVKLDFFPSGCSNKFNMGTGSGPFSRLILFPQGKLAFCGIPKAGITEWIQFLRFTAGAKDYQSNPHYKEDLSDFLFDGRNHELQMKVWEDPSWTRAILIRDPAERFLSAYLDKIQPHNVTFAEFVDMVSFENVTDAKPRKWNGRITGFGLSWYSDPHWRPQAWSCGLSELMPHFQFVGILDHEGRSTKALLQQVGMWDTFGKHYRTSETKTSPDKAGAIRPPQMLKPGEEAPGFQQQNGMDTHGHNMNSRSKLDQYYTPELMERVKRAYWMDFVLWDALKEAKDEGNVNGKYIASKLNPQCTAK